MGAVVSESPCLICEVHESVMHSHHTIPQARGGKNSKQIILCSSCHNILHAHAKHVVAAINKNKPTTKRFWSNPEHEQRASPYVALIVNAFLTPIQLGEQTRHPILSSVDGNTVVLLKLLKQDLGAKSIDETITYCIAHICKQRGITNAQQAQGDSTMWFLPASGPRKTVE